ncbi:F0F1 ATP synthase subunit B [Rhizobium sp. BK251]|uniref:F0F1 ATP synthase subunit B n=1 Tax=Rhizobium sp. BK251 TaxID=2512125 RepID=UPI0010496A51|nr:F0F1 ATP synthase subunit B [Rhizobium sp. BK251]TCL75847.1 F-type H+-transporting ATPase subunit b [Rhizobium sp. BK251]
MLFVTPAYAEEAPAGTETGQPGGTDAHGAPAAGEVHTETGIAEDQHGSAVFPPFDASTFSSQLLWLVITFGVFYLLMQKVIAPRIGAIIDGRHDRIAQDLDEASQLKAEADAAVATYESELAGARAKANTIGAAARESAKAKAEAERAKIEASLAEKLKAAEAHIAEVKAKAFADVGSIAAETASAVVEQLIGAKTTDTEVAAAVAGAKQEA